MHASNPRDSLLEALMAAHTLSDLYVEELRDLYNAERQILKALPKMIKAASRDELKEALESHRQETEGHVSRLEQIFEYLGKNAKGKTCHGMEGVLSEGAELIEEDPDPEVLDAGIIAAAQRVEHYEIAAYGTARTYAQILGEDDAATLLEQTLEEEKATDERLTSIAERVNPQAAEADDASGKRDGGRKRPVAAGKR